MYIGHARVCVSVCVCLSLAACPHYCTHPAATWDNGRGCPLVLHYWANLQSVHGFRCYNNITSNAKCQRVLVLALCLVLSVSIPFNDMIASYDFIDFRCSLFYLVTYTVLVSFREYYRIRIVNCIYALSIKLFAILWVMNTPCLKKRPTFDLL